MLEEKNRTRIKICGLTRLEHVRYASGAMADYLGFIFYERSARYLPPREAAAMISWTEGPDCVGVFVDQTLDDVNEIARNTGIDYVQLHGNETPEYCALMNKPVIKAFRILPEMTRSDLEELVKPYLNCVDYLMFDTYSPHTAGGTGKVFNWEILENWDAGKPFFLSGGLSRYNIAKAIETVNPYAIDVSSSLEESPGVKDFDKMDAFFDEVRKIRDIRADV